MTAPVDNVMSLTEAAARLGVHYMTAYRYVRTGRLAATKDGSQWRVRVADVAAFAAPSRDSPAPRGSRAEGTNATVRGGRRRTNWSGRAEDRLVAGDEAGAWTVMEGAMSAGMSPESLYLDVIVPALRSIGDRWASGDLTVADEHRASGVTHRLVGRLGPRFARRGRKRGTVLLAAPPGELHDLPIALVADLLRSRSFDVSDLGANVPIESLANAAAHTPRLVAVGLCATSPDNEANIRTAIAAVRNVTLAPVVLGGGAIAGQTHAMELGADRGGLSARAVLEAFERLTPVNA